MNRTEERITNCYSYDGLMDILDELYDFPATNVDLIIRLLIKLNNRRKELEVGVNAEPPDAKPFRPYSLLLHYHKMRRWKAITKTDADGDVWLIGWERKASSRKSEKQRILKVPRLISKADKIVIKGDNES